MAGNEGRGPKNPWDGGNGEGPPDLDALLKRMQRKFGTFGSNNNAAGSGGGGIGLGLIGVALLAAWALSGLYKVDEPERGVELRFGQYVETTTPGLHWHYPWPIEVVYKVNVASIEKYQHSTRMLTSDENIIVVDLAIQYRRANPSQYLFNVQEPDLTLNDVSESAIREVVGESTLDFILREGRAAIAQRTAELIQTTLDAYETGIQITSANLQDANFPTQVQAAVQDAIKAREDQERYSLEAEAYANDVLPRARGAAARQIEAAIAHRDQVIADAEGESERFLALLKEYEAAPEVTRQRLYLETVEDVYGRSNKVLMDADDNGNLLYLPLDKLMEQQRGRGTGTVTRTPNSAVVAPTSETTRRAREDARSRGGR